MRNAAALTGPGSSNVAAFAPRYGTVLDELKGLLCAEN
jgi:hypothetical protein